MPQGFLERMTLPLGVSPDSLWVFQRVLIPKERNLPSGLPSFPNARAFWQPT